MRLIMFEVRVFFAIESGLDLCHTFGQSFLLVSIISTDDVVDQDATWLLVFKGNVLNLIFL